MRELDLPEPPTFQPLWPPPAPSSAGAAGASVGGLAPRERLAAAAQAIPGAALRRRSGARGAILGACGQRKCRRAERMCDLRGAWPLPRSLSQVQPVPAVLRTRGVLGARGCTLIRPYRKCTYEVVVQALPTMHS